MKRHFVLLVACVLASIFLAGAELGGDSKSDDTGASVLIETTELQQGSLPHIVRGYGTVQASSSAGWTVMAPLSTVVGQIYVRPGQVVAADAPLIRLVPTPKTVAAYAQAKSAVAVAAQLVERTQKLLAQHLATEQQLADAEKSLSDARSELAAQEAQGAAGPNVLKAPFRAIVTTIVTSPGAIVSEGSNLLDLAKPEGLVLQVGVVPEQAALIESGEKVEIMPLGKAAPAAGQVLQRGSIVNSTNGLVSVEIELPRGKFLLGQMATAAITTGETKGYIVPHAAILVDDKGQTYVMQAVNMVARKVAVHVLELERQNGRDRRQARRRGAGGLGRQSSARRWDEGAARRAERHGQHGCGREGPSKRR